MVTICLKTSRLSRYYVVLRQEGHHGERGTRPGSSISEMRRAMAARSRKAVYRVFERHHEIMERRKSGEASESGFTLIELLIVIVVLGILAAIVVFSLTGVSGQSKQAACTADAKSVEIAADAFQAKNSAYPTSITTDLVPNYLHSAPGTGNGYTI